jgi:hypothetical protein
MRKSGRGAKSARKQADTVARAQKASAAYRERQQMAKDND